MKIRIKNSKNYDVITGGIGLILMVASVVLNSVPVVLIGLYLVVISKMFYLEADL